MIARYRRKGLKRIKAIKRISGRCVALVSLALLVVLAGLWLAFERWVETAPDPLTTWEYSPVVRDRHGQPLSLFLSADGYWRQQTRLSDVDPTYLAMLLAYEDKRFYSHHGVDWLALVRATGQALWHRDIVSGGSTLTMQVVRLLQREPTQTMKAKLAQIRAALALERRLDKKAILELYLNLAPMGGNLEGVATASRGYFGKGPGFLSAAEAALLVAIPQSPVARQPHRHPEQARAARERVLERSLSDGLLSAEVVEEAKAEPIPQRLVPMPHLSWHLAQALVAEARHSAARSLVIDTTLDAGLQRRLELALRRWLGQQVADVGVAMMVVDYHTGEVRARIGAPDPFDEQHVGFVDMAAAKRSPGSTLKPLIYALGFDEGLIHPETLINDAPQDFDGWSPSNFDGRFRGPVSVRRALQESLNLPAVAVLDAISPARLLGSMRRSGAQPMLPGGHAAGLAIGLGGLGVTLQDMAMVYAMIANDGQVVPLTVLPDSDAVPQRVISARASWYLADILRQTPRGGLGASDKVAFKTGTSYGYRDAWAIGFDGQHVIAVLVGRPDNGSMPGALGAYSAAPLLFAGFDIVGVVPPRRTPPKDALIASSGDLPKALRTFAAGTGGEMTPPIRILAPRDGAEVFGVADSSMPLFVHLQGGTPPFRWLINNRPMDADPLRREAAFDTMGGGFHRITVLDAAGHSANATVRLMP